MGVGWGGGGREKKSNLPVGFALKCLCVEATMELTYALCLVMCGIRYWDYQCDKFALSHLSFAWVLCVLGVNTVSITVSGFSCVCVVLCSSSP